MKKRTKEFISILLILCVATMLFATGSEESSTKDVSSSEKTEFTICDEPLTFTAFITHHNTYIMDNEKWTIYKEAGRFTNVYLDGVASQLTKNTQESFNLMIASHEIPDLCTGQNTDLMKYGQEGAFIPLNDLIDEYAPNFKAYLEENPDIKSAITDGDGTMYFIPNVYEEGPSEAWFIRKDWLDKFNLEVPETVEELHQALLTFKNEDANGNGDPDEIGLFARGMTNRCINGLLNLFGINQFWHTTDGDGVVAFGPYTPEYKDAMKGVSQWYDEGLIDPEIFTRGKKSRTMLYSEDNGALIHDWISSTSSFNDKMVDLVPGFELVGMLPPADVDGIRWEASTRNKLYGMGWSIGYNCKNPVEAMKYMDFWWTETGRRLMTYGIEGDTYTMIDGEPVYNEKVVYGGTGHTDVIRNKGGLCDCVGYQLDSSYEKVMMSEAGFAASKAYKDSGMVSFHKPQVGSLGLTTEELTTINEKWPTCKTYIFEQQQKWTFDGSNIDAEFDQYLENLKNMGMDKVVAAYQSAYDRAYK